MQDWKRVWNKEKFDNIAEDERFLPLVIRGALQYLSNYVKLYNKSIRHYILNSGTEYLYMEKTGYEFSYKKVTGEDMIYLENPRCICSITDITISKNNLTSPYIRGNYERQYENELTGMSSEFRRIPLEINLDCKYVLNNFNESLILTEELINNFIFIKYYNISYLGQIIQCSIEIPDSYKNVFQKIQFNNESKDRNLDLTLKISTNYPSIDTKSEIKITKVISEFTQNTDIYSDNENKIIK